MVNTFFLSTKIPMRDCITYSFLDEGICKLQPVAKNFENAQLTKKDLGITTELFQEN